MPDSLLGFFYADLFGVGRGISRERVASHLRCAYRYAHRGYFDGRVGRC